MTQPVRSRWLRSEITFGPAGRIVATVLVVAPALFGIFVSADFFIFGVLWLFIVPMALRDIWRRVKVPDAESPIVIPEEPKAPAPGESIQDRKPPARW
ncbi:MAG TPA: hypothetical protein VG899_16565 [Mycobacteriales bacterium]|nr:hypothetical protein [Mycobacteriales bacterium]